MTLNTTITPWMTSNDLIAAVKRKISFPISQSTFTEEDILAFANEELMISQVPSMLSYHQEYFVFQQEITLVDNQDRYPIPERAIGMKLRDVFFIDDQGNLFDMTRVNSEDRAFFQRNIGANQAIHKFYLEGNDVIVAPHIITAVTGSLLFLYYLRPNQLVTNDNAAFINYFSSNITVNNTTLIAGDLFNAGPITFTAVTGAPSALQFQIGATSTDTATNLINAINLDGTYTAVATSPASNVFAIQFTDLAFNKTYNNTINATTSFNSYVNQSSGSNRVWGPNGSPQFSSNNQLAIVQDTTNLTINFLNIPANITDNSTVDFLQTKSGHRTRAIDVAIGNNAISGNNITFAYGDIPLTVSVGDYICLINQCIIPQIPTDLHTTLAERTSARILAAIGDQAGLAVANQKVGEMERNQGTMLDNRVEGTPIKILARHSLLRYGKRGTIRRT